MTLEQLLKTVTIHGICRYYYYDRNSYEHIKITEEEAMPHKVRCMYAVEDVIYIEVAME